MSAQRRCTVCGMEMVPGIVHGLGACAYRKPAPEALFSNPPAPTFTKEQMQDLSLAAAVGGFVMELVRPILFPKRPSFKTRAARARAKKAARAALARSRGPKS